MDGRTLVDVKQVELNKLEWSSTAFKVYEFLARFSLPQIVKVMEGFYGDDEQSSLGADQVLTLHVVKSTDKIMGRDYRGKEVNIPLNCSSKVEVRPSNLKDVYETVDELWSVFPNHVRISQGYYSAAKDEEILNVGDKLRLKNITKGKKGDERVVCVNQNGQTIELPRDCVAGFQPLADGNEYYLAEVASQFTLPLYVQFVDPPVVGNQNYGPGNNSTVFNSALGSIYLEKSYTENMVIASTISNDGQRTVVTFPRDIDIRIAVCEGMLQNSRNYALICENLNNGVDLTYLRNIDAYNAFRPRNSVREYSYRELVTYDSPLNLETEDTEVEASGDDGSKAEGGAPEIEGGASVNGEKEVQDQAAAANEDAGEGDRTKKLKEENDRDNRKETAGKRGVHKPPLRQNSAVVVRKDKGIQSPTPDEPLQPATADRDTALTLQAAKAEPAPNNSEVAPSPSPKVFVRTENTSYATAKKAPDVSSYSVKQVSDVLRDLGMAKYVVKFEAEMIDGEMLTCLDDAILTSDFGMNKLHCMKLKKYLEGWRPKV